MCKCDYGIEKLDGGINGVAKVIAAPFKLVGSWFS